MKDRGSNLEEVLKSMLSVISNDRIIHKEGPTMSALEAANGVGRRPRNLKDYPK